MKGPQRAASPGVGVFNEQDSQEGALAGTRAGKATLRTLAMLAGAAMAALNVGGCAVMPRDGPTARAVSLEDSRKEGGYSLVALDYRAAEVINKTPLRALASMSAAQSDAPIDLIGEGDVLAVSIFEAGYTGLFSSRNNVISASPETLPQVLVERGGVVNIPYGGPVKVAGLTPTEAAAAIRAALKGKTADPQIAVSIVENLANSVTIIGEVRNAGRMPIKANGDRILDVIASAGGPTKPIEDLTILVVRGKETVSAPLSVLMDDPSQNVRLAPRDQVRLLFRPRTYSTFGAFQQVSERQIENQRLTLAGAISRSGGLDDRRANVTSVFLFRFERPEVAEALGAKALPTERGVPVIYKLDLSEPQALFVANSVQIRSDDLIYVPSSRVAETRKFFEFVQALTRVVYDVRVASLIGNE